MLDTLGRRLQLDSLDNQLDLTLVLSPGHPHLDHPREGVQRPLDLPPFLHQGEVARVRGVDGLPVLVLGLQILEQRAHNLKNTVQLFTVIDRYDLCEVHLPFCRPLHRL